MERVVRIVERTAGFFLALVALLIFVSVVLRYGFARNLPDAFDFSAYLQGIAILWGLSVATWRGGHIAVDLLWESAGPRGKRAIDLFAAAVTTVFFILLAVALAARLPETMETGQVTTDLRLPVWPFHVVGTCGAVACAIVAVIALVRGSRMRTDGSDG